MHTANFLQHTYHHGNILTHNSKGVDLMKKLFSLLLCTVMLAGCGNTDIEKTSDSEKKEVQSFRIGSMENDADLSKCNLNGWCEITDENYSYRTTYRGELKDSGELWEFIENLDLSGFEKAQNGLDEEYSVTIESSEAGFIRISSGMVTVVGYDDLENINEDLEPAISIQTGENAQNCNTEIYLVPNKVRQQFDDIVTNSIANKDNITDVYKLPDCSYTSIIDSYPKDLIVFVDGYSNYANGIQNSGRFIDLHGYVYEYNLDDRRITDETKERTGNEDISYEQAFVDTLYCEFYYKNSPIAMVDADTVFDCYMKMYDIDRDADFETKHECCDYGEKALFMIDIDSEIMCVKLREKGDNTGKLDDPSAEEIMEAYDSLEFWKIP